MMEPWEVPDHPFNSLPEYFIPIDHYDKEGQDLRNQMVFAQSRQSEASIEIEAAREQAPEIKQKLLESFARLPDWFALTNRQFEELICEMLERDGFKPTLTKATRDGGYDIAAYLVSEWAKTLYLVECKHYSPRNVLGVSYARSLYGVVEQKSASGGILVTTSTFSKDAVSFAEPKENRLSLRDGKFLDSWIQRIQASRG